MGICDKGVFSTYGDRYLKKKKLAVLLENGSRVTVKPGGRVPSGPKTVRVSHVNIERSFKDCEDSYMKGD